MLALLLAVVSVFVRYRSGRDGGAAAAPLVPGGGADLHRLVLRHRRRARCCPCSAALGLASLPIAAGIAILRYRLYDLELVVKRTLVYGVATGVLAGLYFGIVLALQQVFSSFAGGSDLAVAVLDARRRRAVRTCPAADPAGSRPALLPPPLRRSTNPRELLRQPAGRDRPRRARRGAPRGRAGDDAARTGLALVTAAGHTNVSTRTATRLAWSLYLALTGLELEAELAATADETMQPAQVSVWLRGRAT